MPRLPRLDPDVKTVTSLLRFDGPFPELAAYTVKLPEGLRDDAGRALANGASFPLEVRTDKYPALLKFPGRFGIPQASDAVLPVTVRGIEPASAERRSKSPARRTRSPGARRASAATRSAL